VGATVLAAKMGLKAASKSDAFAALAELARLPVDSAETAARQLQEEFNVLEWGEGFNAFDILGDAVPRTQFLAYIRRYVAAAYDECKTRCSTFWLAGVDAVFMFFTAQPWLLCFVRSANGAM